MKYITNNLANSIGVTTNTIRRYEEYGFLSPCKNENNYREFDYFDIVRAAQVRLCGKCGFSNDEISQMLDKGNKEIQSIYNQKIDCIERQIEQLESYKSWLIDNNRYIEFAASIGDGSIIGKSTPMRYIAFRKGFEQLDSPELSKAIKEFTYNTPEVYVINIGKRDKENADCVTQYTAWAIKESNIDRLGLRAFVDSCPFVEKYTEQECIFTVQNIPNSICNDIGAVIGSMMPKWEKVIRELRDKGYEPNGDIMQLYINVIGNPITILECQPIRKITQQ